MKQLVPIIPYLLEQDASGQISISHHTIFNAYPTHGHDYYEMELVTAGDGFQWINNVRTPMKTGSLFLLTPNDIHRIETDGLLRSISIHCLPETAAALGLDEVHEAISMQLREADYDLFCALCLRLLQPDAAAQPYFSRELFAAASLLLVHLLRSGQTRFPIAHTRRTLPALKYIQSNYARSDLRLCDAAQVCGLSVCHFSAMFHETVGCCFSEYLMNFRLHRAGSLLAHETATVSEIAYAVGFSSLPHFFRAFRRAYGCTPLQYRQQAIHDSAT